MWDSQKNLSEWDNFFRIALAKKFFYYLAD